MVFLLRQISDWTIYGDRCWQGVYCGIGVVDGCIIRVSRRWSLGLPIIGHPFINYIVFRLLIRGLLGWMDLGYKLLEVYIFDWLIVKELNINLFRR